MESYIVVVLYIGEAFTPHAWMLRVVHVKNVYDNPVDDIYLAISLGVEICGISKFGI